ncbi:hypothetical protein CRENBAI_004219 [Crenichthys baileyi]|uniref:Uncharacterized protein n=1 Tax=Crenichthys baileyi TaxID=28760 RepID=A0AAV9SM81_9TELE
MAQQRCFNPPTPSSLSPDLLLYTEGNKDTRRISVVCLTKWLPESERAVPMGTTTSPALSKSPPPPTASPPPARASLRSVLSQGALWMSSAVYGAFHPVWWVLGSPHSSKLLAFNFCHTRRQREPLRTEEAPSSVNTWLSLHVHSHLIMGGDP